MGIFIRLHLFKFDNKSPDFGTVDVQAWKEKWGGKLLAENIASRWKAGSPLLADTFIADGPFTAIEFRSE